MAYLKIQEFQQKINKSSFETFYIFAGDERLLLDEGLNSFEKQFNVNSLSREVFFGGDISADDIMIGMQTLPMFSDKKLVIVKDAQKIKSAEAVKIAELTKINIRTSCFVLIWNSRVRMEDKKNPLFLSFDKKGCIVEFKQPYESALPAWVRDTVQSSGKKISSDAAAALIRESGPGLMDLKNEIEKLCLYSGSVKEITLSDVEAVSGHTRFATLNTFAENIEGKLIKYAIKTSENLLAEGEIPLKMLATIYRVIRRLLTGKYLMEKSGLTKQDAGRELRLHAYFDKNFFSNLSKYSTKELENSLENILKADYDLKSSSRTESIIFDELLLSLSSK